MPQRIVMSEVNPLQIQGLQPILVYFASFQVV